jgi:LysR family transcriptional regulator for bpeEF and oprC
MSPAGFYKCRFAINNRVPMDKFRAMTLFCRAVETRSFASAATALEVPPSVVSRTISALESTLGCTLFNRTTRRLSLTEAGASYYERCRELLAEIEQIEALARDGTMRPTGILRVGYHPALRSPIVRSLNGFLAAHEGLSIEFTTTNAPAALLDDGLDIVLRVGPIPDSSFVARRLGSAALLTCAAPAYLARVGRPSRPRDLAGHRAIIPGRRDETSFAQWRFSRSGMKDELVDVPVGLVVRDGVGLADLTAEGAGIAQIYDTTACYYIADGRLEPILKQWSAGRQPVFAVVPSRRNVPAKVHAFLNFAASVLSGRKRP